MSAKSRLKKERRNANKPSPDHLSMQKQTMKRAFLDHLCVSVLLLTVTIGLCAVGLFTEDASLHQRIIFGVTPILLCITIFFIGRSLHRFMIFSKFSKIKFSSEHSTNIICKKMAFLTQPIHRYSCDIICIVLTDEKGKKYYNVINGISAHAKKQIKKDLLNAKVSIVCYANTNCIKAFHVDEKRKEEHHF